MRRRWTEEETREALALHAAGKRPRIIARRLGRTVRSVSGRIDWVTMTPERREKIRARVNETRPAWRRERRSVHRAAVAEARLQLILAHGAPL